MVTIKQVAEKADVSTATVSRVINGNYPVSEKARKKVVETIKELGYRPNSIARSLKCNKTYMVGMVVPDISNNYFMDIARGVESVISPLGYSLIFCSTDENTEKELKLLNALNDKRVDFVLLASSTQQSDKLKKFINQGMNIILIDTSIKDLETDIVVEDNFNATYKLISYVIDQGHRRIGAINGFMGVSTAKERYNGFLHALEDHDIPLEESYVVNGYYDRKKAYEEVKLMLQKNMSNLPTALFAANNDMAEGAMIALKEMNLKIPDDISLVSFGDINIPELVEPRLTIISQNSVLIGKKAGELMVRKVVEAECRENGISKISIPSEIIIRDSVKSI
ncbi:LacI family transcriptional regulator [Vallitalea longa]|uniref:LacI family transcriptional regulator n=1 Tax=Vallitalea longa TaxID=2936439 RepID=A0A9W6DE97_9FIRM|nr:LacI family DNA-binding transcriptional regulator [Vallitalea longa]GKX28188.1 LacI family transcriptional regulator [Vallitalea longa]